MQRSRTRKALGRGLIAAVIFVSAGTARQVGAADICAQVVSLQGLVEIQHSGESAWQRVERLDTRLCEGDRLRVGPLGRAALLVGPSALIRVDQNTVMGLRITADETLVEFDSGAIYSISRFPRRYRINSPFVNANVEGTEFLVSLGESRAEVAVYEGRVWTEDRIGTRGDKAVLQRGQVARFSRGNAAEIQALVNPTDAVQWALYYPALDATPDLIAQLVRVGRVDEAERQLRAAGQRADALALGAIIRVTKNDRAGALQLAQQAVAADPNSARAYLARSYALQADFRLDEALAAATRAVELDRRSSTARARQAELLLSLGRLREAEQAASAAVDANPDESRAHTILGFAQLARFSTAKAREQFQIASKTDVADPLPRLGLGLADIRDGRLAQGREQIEIAVSLDPQNSLLRSYLGKAYSDERRDALAGDQFDRAQKLDERDPTPWFYNAIRLQLLNRPNEALQDLEASAERNDNRAVYRSRLLLDEDQAARSASRARMYSDLGFDELALRAAKAGLAADPGSFSAHRFLAEAYLAQPNFEVARVSETLQSQLLQPVNAAALPPQLLQIRSPMLLGSGPITPSFQEFNPLFARDRHSLSLSGVAGSADTWADEIMYGYYAGGHTVQLAQSRYDTNGFRENADLRQDFLRAFYQHDTDPRTGFQLEANRSVTVSGDTRFQFDPSTFSPAQRSRLESNSFRIGGRYSWRPDSVLIGSFIFERQDTGFSDAFSFPPIEVQVESPSENHSGNGELQYQFRGQRFDVVTGGGLFERKERGESRSTVSMPPIVLFSSNDPFEGTQRSRNAYVYSHIGRPSSYRLVLGLAVDHAENTDPAIARSDTQLNPKLGAILPISSATTVRLAAFRGLKRLPSANPTIEPTQVAGFNQIFDGVTQTRFWRYGAGIDHSWSRRLHGGLELTQRDLEVPFNVNFPVEHRREWLHSAYLSQLIGDRIALGAEARLERIDRTPTGNLLTPTQMDTRSLPLTATYHQPSGFFARARLTFVDQEIESPDATGARGERRNEGFKVFDLSFGQRLPRRWGLMSLDIKNVFNEKFSYQDTTFEGFPRVPQYAPERAFYARVQLNL